MMQLKLNVALATLVAGIFLGTSASAAPIVYGQVDGSAFASITFVANGVEAEIGSGSFTLTSGSLTFDSALPNSTLSLSLSGSADSDILLSSAIMTGLEVPPGPTTMVDVSAANVSGSMDAAGGPAIWVLSENVGDPLAVTATVSIDGGVTTFPYASPTTGADGFLQATGDPAIFTFSTTFIQLDDVTLIDAIADNGNGESIDADTVGSLSIKIRFNAAAVIPEPSGALLSLIALTFATYGASSRRALASRR